jgi:hypothetical protein
VAAVPSRDMLLFHDVTRPPLPAVVDPNKRFFYFNLHFLPARD